MSLRRKESGAGFFTYVSAYYAPRGANEDDCADSNECYFDLYQQAVSLTTYANLFSFHQISTSYDRFCR